jgi:hypothetical protein
VVNAGEPFGHQLGVLEVLMLAVSGATMTMTVIAVNSR